MRIFLDANVLFSAAKSDGAVRVLLRRLIALDHECCVDDYVVVEARRNLGAKGPDALAAFDALLTHLQVGTGLSPASDPKQIDWLPDKDRPVLSAAIRSSCAALVTGDKTHFGAGYGKTFGGVTIHSPRSIAESLLGG